MSLIEEALRRVQDPSPKTEEQRASATISSSEAAVSVPVEPPPQPRVEAHSWSTASPMAESASAEPARSLSTAQATLLMAVLIVAIGSWGMGQSRSTPAPAASVTPAAPAARRHPMPQQPAPTIRPADGPSVPAARAQGELQLSGIVVGGRTSYAVINGSIFTVGDSVGELTLTKVTRESATLRRSDGTEVVLRIPH